MLRLHWLTCHRIQASLAETKVIPGHAKTIPGECGQASGTTNRARKVYPHVVVSRNHVMGAHSIACSLSFFVFSSAAGLNVLFLSHIHQRCEEVREGYVRCTTVLVSKTFVTSLHAPTSEYVVGQVWSMLRETRLTGAECFFLSVNLNVKFGIT